MGKQMYECCKHLAACFVQMVYMHVQTLSHHIDRTVLINIALMMNSKPSGYSAECLAQNTGHRLQYAEMVMNAVLTARCNHLV